MLTELVGGAQRKEFSTVLFWALDRLDRRGIASTLGIVHRLMATGCRLVSLQESWLEAEGSARELLLAVMAWCAQQESGRRSERIRAGLARRRAMGLPVGRLPGARDKKRRRRTGYLLRFAG